MNKDDSSKETAQNKNGAVITDDEPVQEGHPVKEKPPLPEIGKRFYIDGTLYKVTYVNQGKKRFSAEIANQ